ncbi:Membrane protein [Labilithrix luteola]|uniref:Membrane protein n=1 Tax=Labilithrix luteola TaxID=1391654 RepID=A0A0K1PXJ2_9BACT|nr:HupE/UreJ family protein [Labilithrix luteola]AKU98222.1 Membrane protein [Labilithrix luteola]
MSMRIALALLLGSIAFCFGVRAEAHQVGLSRGNYVLEDDRVEAEIVFAHRDLAAALPALDRDGDGKLSARELDDGASIVDAGIVRPFSIGASGGACQVALTSLAIDGEDAIVRARATCPAGGHDLTFGFGFLEPFPSGHRHLVHVRAGNVDQETVAMRTSPTILVDTGHPIVASRMPSFFGMGIEHILTGYDHLAFLAALVVVGGRARGLFKAITAFTLAHSASLALAVLGIWTPAPRFVEPAIALSIAYVGVENFFVRDTDKRWRITLPFGFVHGFGFAGALAERNLPAPRIPAALLGFNLGVEAGQIAILALVVPLVMLARNRFAVVRTWLVPAINVAGILAGLVWLWIRLHDATR